MSKLFECRPKVGLVIGTSGTAPYIHLHLETAKQLYPDIPILVHDDCSGVTQLQDLCDQYGVSFCTSDRPLGHFHGDLSVFVRGLRWADASGYDLLVKMSRRFLPLRDWRDELATLALEGQYPTYSSYCEDNFLQFRTECVALHVKSWMSVADELETKIANREPIYLVERYFHGLSKKVNRGSSGSYVLWPLIGTSRMRRCEHHLWHNSALPSDYGVRARVLGLCFKDEDFEQ